MKLKTKLASLIIGFVMVASMLFFGVWAASSANVTLGGTISFQSTNVYAEVSGTISGAASGNVTLDTLTFSSSTTTDTSTWANKNIELADGGETAKTTISITIKNLASDRPLYVSVTDTIGEVTNVEKTIDSTSFELGAKDSGTDSKTVTIQMWVENSDLSVESVDYAFEVILANNQEILSAEDVDNYKDILVFDCNTSTGLASVSAASKDIEGAITIPSYVKNSDGIFKVSSIPEYGFSFYGSGAGISSIVIPSTVTTIGDGAFEFCSNLTSVTFSEGLQTIGNSAFYAIGELGDIVFPDSLVSIGDSAFMSTSVGSVQFSKNLKYLGDSSFVTSGISEAILPEGLTYLGTAFGGNMGLKKVVIPKSITNILSGTFNGCQIETVGYRGTEEEWAKITIGEENSTLATASRIYNYAD